MPHVEVLVALAGHEAQRAGCHGGGAPPYNREIVFLTQ